MHRGRNWPRRLDTLILGYWNPPLIPYDQALPLDAVFYYNTVFNGFDDIDVGPQEVAYTDGIYTFGDDRVHYRFDFTPIVLPTSLDLTLILDQTFNPISHWEWQWTQNGVAFPVQHSVLLRGVGWEGDFTFNNSGGVFEEPFASDGGGFHIICGHYYDGTRVLP